MPPPQQHRGGEPGPQAPRSPGRAAGAGGPASRAPGRPGSSAKRPRRTAAAQTPCRWQTTPRRAPAPPPPPPLQQRTWVAAGRGWWVSLSPPHPAPRPRAPDHSPSAALASRSRPSRRARTPSTTSLAASTAGRRASTAWRASGLKRQNHTCTGTAQASRHGQQRCMWAGASKPGYSPQGPRAGSDSTPPGVAASPAVPP